VWRSFGHVALNFQGNETCRVNRVGVDRDLSGRGAARAEVAQGTPSQSRISPNILVYEDNCSNALGRNRIPDEYSPGIKRSCTHLGSPIRLESRGTRRLTPQTEEDSGGGGVSSAGAFALGGLRQSTGLDCLR